MRSPHQLQGVFVDSSAFGAFAKTTDQYHWTASDILGAIARSNRPMITTNFIVAETHALMLARGGRDLALRALQLIDHSVELLERVTIEDEHHARQILEHHDDKAYSYTDATSFAVMERLGLRDVFTFDRHFEQFGFSLLKPA